MPLDWSTGMNALDRPPIALQLSPPAIVARLRAAFDSGRTRPVTYRLEQLAGLARFLKDREPRH